MKEHKGIRDDAAANIAFFSRFFRFIQYNCKIMAIFILFETVSPFNIVFSRNFTKKIQYFVEYIE